MLKLQYFGYLMWRIDSLEKTLMVRKTEDEMVGWHHWLDGHEFEQALGVGDGQESLVCCSPWDHRVRHDWVTELNWLKRIILEKNSYSNSPCFISETDDLGHLFLSLSVVVDWWLPKDISTWTLRMSSYLEWRSFADVTKAKILRWGHSGLRLDPKSNDLYL